MLRGREMISICTNSYLVIKIHYSQDARYVKEKSIFNNQTREESKAKNI